MTDPYFDDTLIESFATTSLDTDVSRPLSGSSDWRKVAGGSFTLGADAVFNPPTQAVTMTISSASFGPLSLTIPAGSFKLVKGQYKYSGTIDGVNYGVTIFAPVDGVYQFTFAAFGVDVTGITNQVTVTLQIGTNIGPTTTWQPQSYRLAIRRIGSGGRSHPPPPPLRPRREIESLRGHQTHTVRGNAADEAFFTYHQTI
jgi:hypothetical protein